jgi:hypothetical protein
MSTLSQLLGGGRFLSDPRQLLAVSAASGAFSFALSAASINATTATFFTGGASSVDRGKGTDVDSNWTATTYKTIVNLTATKGGFFTGFLGPTLASGGDTVTVRYTIDGGASVTRTMTAQANAHRCYHGLLLEGSTFITEAFNRQFKATGSPSDGTTYYSSDTDSTLIPIMSDTALSLGSAMVIFQSSLLIEAQISQNLTTTTNQERRCAAFWRRFL